MSKSFIIYCILVVIAFGVGEYAGRMNKDIHVITKTKTNVEEKEVEHKKIVIVTNKDGSKVETETDDTNTNTDTVSVSNTSITKSSSPKWNFSVLAGVDYSKLSQVEYGISVNRQFLGPITIGLWGFKDRAGVSVGVNF